MYYVIDEPYNVSCNGSITYSNDNLVVGVFADLEQANNCARHYSTLRAHYQPYLYKNVYVIEKSNKGYEIMRPFGGFCMRAIRLLRPWNE